jgi:hypothetical protein
LSSIPVRGFGKDGLLVTAGVGHPADDDQAVVNGCALVTVQAVQLSEAESWAVRPAVFGYAGGYGSVPFKAPKVPLEEEVNGCRVVAAQAPQLGTAEVSQRQSATAETGQAPQAAAASVAQRNTANGAANQPSQVGAAAVTQTQGMALSVSQAGQRSEATMEREPSHLYALMDLDEDLAIAMGLAEIAA